MLFRAGTPTLDVGAESRAATDRNAGVLFRAGTPTLDVGAESRAVTEREAGVLFRAGNPTLDVGAEARAGPLVLSDWDNDGLDVEFSALIEVSGAADLYADSDRGGTDTPIAGELGVGPGDTALSRIRWDTGTDRLILNDNDSPGALNLGNFFNTGGAGNDLTIYVTNDAGTNSFPVSSHLLSSAPNVVRFQNLPAALVTVLDAVSVGDRLIFSAARMSPATDREAGVLFRAGAPTLSAGAEARSLTDRSAGVLFRAGIPTLDVGAEARSLTDRNAGVLFRAGSPTLNVGAEARAATDRSAGVLFRAGSPTLNVGADSQVINNRNAGVLFRAGSPTLSAGAETQVVDTTPQAPPRKPGEARHLETTNTGTTAVILSWIPPVDSGTAPILSYDVSVDGGSWENTGSPATTRRIAGLAIGGRYSFRVRPVTADGVGDATPFVYATPLRTSPDFATLPGESVPLENVDRQSLVVRLGGFDCGLVGMVAAVRQRLVCVLGRARRGAKGLR